MPKTRRVHRSDANTHAIVEALRAIGASVEYLDGKGRPDLLVGYLGANYLLEVKRGTERLNADQIHWHGAWEGQVNVVRTIADALRVLKIKVESMPLYPLGPLT